MIVLRVLAGSRSALAEVRRRTLWGPFALLAAAPVAVTAAAVLFFGVQMTEGGEGTLPQSLLLGGVAIGIPLAWAGRCAGSALLLSWSGTLLGVPARLGPMALAAAAASAPLSLEGLLQSLTTLGYRVWGAGPAPLLEDTLALVFGDALPGGAAGAALASVGFFDVWSALLLALAVAEAGGSRLRTAWLQILPLELVVIGCSAGSRLLMEHAG